MSTLRPAVFLDRDGTLNEMVYDPNHGIMDSPFWPEHFVLKRAAGPFVRALNELGYLTIVVTNQPGVAKGTLTLERLDRIHRRMRAELAEFGAVIDAIYHSPYHPEPGPLGRAEFARRSPCRKPLPGMWLKAARDHQIDLPRSLTVGDGLVDVEAGKRAGTRTIFLSRLKPEVLERIHSRPECRPDHTATDLGEALAIIRSQRAETIVERG